MDYLHGFEEHLKDEGKSPHTLKAYLSDLRQYGRWLKDSYGDEEITPQGITKRDVVGYKSYLQTVTKRMPAGINRALSSISAFCDWAVASGFITANPVDQVSQVQQVKTPPKALDERDLNRLLREVHKAGNERDIAMLELMVGAGLRIGEVEALDVADIQVSERQGAVTVRRGKGSKYRRVPLNKDVRAALLGYLQVRRKDSGEALFVSQKGGRLTSNGIWKVVTKYGEETGIEGLTPHALRHTFATDLIRKHGVDIVTAAALLGHSNISTTAIYTKPNQQDLEDAVERLSKL